MLEGILSTSINIKDNINTYLKIVQPTGNWNIPGRNLRIFQIDL
jgi:hypothetical protein